jgi:hypothetical protein
MKSLQHIGLGLALLSFMGFISIVCIAGLLIKVTNTSSSFSWAVLKKQLPSFLALVAFLTMVALMVYGVVLAMRYYGA